VSLSHGLLTALLLLPTDLAGDRQTDLTNLRSPLQNGNARFNGITQGNSILCILFFSQKDQSDRKIWNDTRKFNSLYFLFEFLSLSKRLERPKDQVQQLRQESMRIIILKRE
jgi:hypothetical protein